ncbi:MAG: RluA family pseudouridine synthase [Candidatus Omnitrophota bacterium]
MREKIFFEVEKEYAGQRVDKYLQKKLILRFSRTLIKKNIENNNVLVNSLPVKPHHKLKKHDKISVSLIQQESHNDMAPLDIPLDVVFEDDCILVINKPAGMVVHPAAGHRDDTLVNALLARTSKLSDVSGPVKLGVVHRLDKDTSGLLVVAKDNRAHEILAEQFKKHQVKKIYIALVLGRVERDEGLIDAPLSRNPFNRKKIAVVFASKRNAQTYYRVLKRNNEYSVLEVQPKTGRTHQIRVHLAYLGHSIIGDKTYGKTSPRFDIQRQALHASLLGFLHPRTSQYVEFKVALPEDMRKIAERP